MAEPFTIYKVTILYLLDCSGFPLSNTQISNFFLEQEYTDYFRIQEGISDLVDTGLIHYETTHSNTLYSLTEAGHSSLKYLNDKVTDGIKADVKEFFARNQITFREENSITANYYRTTNQKYSVECKIESDGQKLLSLALTVDNKKQAEAICAQWKESHTDVYACLMDMLLK